MRATIEDRNGEILAISLPTAALFADPRQLMDPADAAAKLKQVLPQLDEATAIERLSSDKSFAYLARRITPEQEIAINALGIPGIYFEPTEERRYPQGSVAAQVLGATDVDGRGVAGVEAGFNARLRDDPDPLRLSIDVRVQAVMRDELSASMKEFKAIGACGIVMDVDSGEVLAMVSLPDYDANDFGRAPANARFNRCATGLYEPGSTFKLQTAAMGLDSGHVHVWNWFDASHDVYFGGFHISDFEGKHRWLALPEVLAYSSNLGAAHIALATGTALQRAWLRKMGMFARVPIQLPEAAFPLVQSKARWQILSTMTVGFGQGISISPLHLVRGTAMLANGGRRIVPTMAALPPGAVPVLGPRLMQRSTSDTVRKLMRLVVTSGFGEPADIPGFYVGGKTGTSEIVSHGVYRKHANVSQFMSVFPMNAPRYAVYFMLDDPKGNASTGFFSTAGAVAAPGAGRVIARIGPMLGIFPDLQDKAAIDASLAIPMQPPAPPGAEVRLVPPMVEPRPPKPPAPKTPAHKPGAAGASVDAVWQHPAPPPVPAVPQIVRFRYHAAAPAPGGRVVAAR